MTREQEKRFGDLVASLQLSALYHLGEIPGPEGEKPSPDLSMARNTIEILEMLRQKTVGNLNPSEQGLIDHALTELQMHFVEKKQ